MILQKLKYVMALLCLCASVCILSFGQTATLSTPQDFEKAANEWQMERRQIKDDTNTQIRTGMLCPGLVKRPDDPWHCKSPAELQALRAAGKARLDFLDKQMQAKYGSQYLTPRDLRKAGKQ